MMETVDILSNNGFLIYFSKTLRISSISIVHIFTHNFVYCFRYFLFLFLITFPLLFFLIVFNKKMYHVTLFFLKILQNRYYI